MVEWTERWGVTDYGRVDRKVTSHRLWQSGQKGDESPTMVEWTERWRVTDYGRVDRNHQLWQSGQKGDESPTMAEWTERWRVTDYGRTERWWVTDYGRVDRKVMSHRLWQSGQKGDESLTEYDRQKGDKCACCASSQCFEPWWTWELRLFKFFTSSYLHIIY